MAMRKASDFCADDHEEPLSKRPRFHENSVASLDSLNADCLLLVLSYLPAEDLNAIAICSRRYRQARSHESLDQTRSGTIVISEGRTWESVVETIINNDWNQVFQGNRTHLKLNRLPLWPYDEFEAASHGVFQGALLPGVTSLDVTFIGPHNRILDRRDPSFCTLFPNLQELDLSSVIVVNGSHFSRCFLRECPRLTKLTWIESRARLCGCSFNHASHLLNFLCLDNSCFQTFCCNLPKMSDLTHYPECFMFQKCHVPRLSIRNATFQYYDEHSTTQIRPVTQKMLIKMARHHPTLRWLRSDLSAENVAMLQQERPDITFVSE